MPRIPNKVRGVFEKVQGSGVWWIRYTDQYHKKHREKVGSHKHAVKMLEQRKTEVSQRKFNPDVVKGKHKVVLFDELVKDRKNEAQTLKSFPDESCRLGHIKTAFKGRPAKVIGHADIQKYLAELTVWRDKKWKKAEPATRNRYLSTLSATFRLAEINKKADENPCKYVKALPENNKVERYLTSDEEESLNKFLPEDLRRAVLVSLDTGLRKSELLSLLWKDVDFGSEKITVREAKAGKIQYVDMNTEVIKAFTELKSKPLDIGGRVFYRISKKRKNGYYVLTSPFEKYLEKAGIKNFRWHDLRHTFVSRLVRVGVNIVTVKELARHASIEMTMRYAHLYPDDRRKAVGLLADYQDKRSQTGTKTGT